MDYGELGRKLKAQHPGVYDEYTDESVGEAAGPDVLKQFLPTVVPQAVPSVPAQQIVTPNLIEQLRAGAASPGSFRVEPRKVLGSYSRPEDKAKRDLHRNALQSLSFLLDPGRSVVGNFTDAGLAVGDFYTKASKSLAKLFGKTYEE